MLILAPVARKTLPFTSGPAEPFKERVPLEMPTLPWDWPGPFSAISLPPESVRIAKLLGPAEPRVSVMKPALAEAGSRQTAKRTATK